MNFSVTERGVFRRCRRQAVLTSKNGQHLTPVFSPLNLSVGSIMHRAHQHWLERPDTPLHEHVLNACSEAQEQTRQNYLKAVGAEPSSAEMLELHEAIDMAISMAEHYAIKYNSPLPPDYKLLSAEQKIVVPIEETAHTCPVCRGVGMASDRENMLYAGTCQNCDGTGVAVHSLEGKLDGLIQHISGRIDILEHKTYKNRPKLIDLQSNDQFLAYIFLVTELKISPAQPQIAYDGMWRRSSVPRGRTIDDLFARYMLPRSSHELQEFRKFLVQELKDMAATYQQPSTAYINRRWDGCWDCRVSSLCLAMSRGEDTQQLIQNNYTQRTDDTTIDDTILEESDV